MSSDPVNKIQNKTISLAIAYKKTFENEFGKKVLFDLMKVGHMINCTFSGSGNAYEMAFREGERNMVLRIMSILKRDVAQLEQMINQGVDNE